MFQSVKVPKELYQKLKKLAEQSKKPFYKVIEEAVENKLVQAGSSLQDNIALASEFAKQLEEKGVFDIKLKAVKVTDIRDTATGLRIDAYAIIDAPDDLKPVVREMLERLM